MFDADNDGIDEVLYIARTDDNDRYIVKLFDAADSTSTTLHEDWSEYSLLLNLLISIKMVIWMWSLEIQVKQLI